jgi:glycosyltransferase involved in cell wall biosynthesis
MNRAIALLGRMDHPTDAVEAYCEFLGAALSRQGVTLEMKRFTWPDHSCSTALRHLRVEARAWHGRWVFVQYTALSWSNRGFPWRFLRVLRLLRRAGARVAVVYHDAEPYTAVRLTEEFRRAVQLITMRRALTQSDLGVLTIPLERVSWLTTVHQNAVFIPVGANMPIQDHSAFAISHPTPTVSVFGVTGGETGVLECQAIAAAVRSAAARVGQIRLLVFGRNGESAEPILSAALRGVPAQLECSGVLPAEGVVTLLASSDVLLFLRGPISSQRGSAIAGIACGLPIIAAAGIKTAGPITEAGIVFVDPGNPESAGEALTRVLQDSRYRESLAERSRIAYSKYFAWDAIAQAYLHAMGNSLRKKMS